ncbi:MAG: phosphoglycerate mutase family protein [Chitinophagaceae bacterium]|nr:histidine phosphatase family protein [Chitinophagaceae bacterium]MBK9660083.1 histidine phosphatase family protein [Chitinophagaceae bacterium]MBP6232366.1 histidine phosphatase family protein [Chitinophagaceae bacterium]MBP6415093.1 histidine phosphatase family protein [Chitinophagaceae bacterium]
MRVSFFVLSLFLLSCSNTVYVVRHAEKAGGIDPVTMKTYADPPLSAEGQERALKLKQLLGNKKIKHIFSTNTTRTISTASPLKELYLGLAINIYSSKADSMEAFIQKIKTIRKGDILIVGHSNTIDDIANKMAGKQVVPGDLKDSEYDNLYILKRKGDNYIFKNDKYGAPSK